MGEIAMQSFSVAPFRILQQSVALVVIALLLVLPIGLLVFLSVSLKVAAICVLLYGLAFAFLTILILPDNIETQLIVTLAYTAGMVGFLGNLASRA